MSSLKVLVVEDDAILAEVYVLKFELEGMEVKHAPNGADALALVREFKPDAILLDLMMPVMDGWEFMAKLGQTHIKTRVIIFSNMLSTENKLRAAKLGAVDTWIKSSFTPEMAARQIIQLCS